MHPEVTPSPGDRFTTPPYHRLRGADLEYAAIWAQQVLAWRRDPILNPRPPRFALPSTRGRRSQLKPFRLGIPAREGPHLPLRLVDIDPAVWRALPPESARMLLAEERELASRLEPGHPAREWARPPFYDEWKRSLWQTPERTHHRGGSS